MAFSKILSAFVFYLLSQLKSPTPFLPFIFSQQLCSTVPFSRAPLVAPSYSIGFCGYVGYILKSKQSELRSTNKRECDVICPTSGIPSLEALFLCQEHSRGN